MKPLQQKQKNTFHISLFVVAVLTLLVITFLVLTPPKAPKPKVVAHPKVEAVTKGSTISEDSLKREREREKEREREEYAKEQARFAKVLSEASDEELFVVLKYAIANQYVPNRDIDPYGYVFVGITRLHRSYLIYEKLSSRKDLLCKIYPDVQLLDEYVHWGRQSGQPYKNSRISRTILHNAQKDKEKMDAQMGSVFDTSSMAYKYFGTPLMSY